MTARIVKRIKYLDLAVEEEDNRFYVTKAGERVRESGSDTVAIAYMEIMEDEYLAAHPEFVNPSELLKRERAFNDILSVRGSSRAAARDKANQKGGKGGRGGV